jgi:hypothetical protein
MESLKKPSLLEKAASSLPVQSGLTAVGAYAANVMEGGGPAIAAMLPVLATALASNRQAERVKEAITKIDSTLAAHSDQLAKISDAQYKLINEIVSAVFSTTCHAKLNLLQAAVAGAISSADLPSNHAVLLSRVLRDISFEELTFLRKYFSFSHIELAEKPGGYKGNVATISRVSEEGLYASGLVALGLLVPAENTFDQMGLLRFSPLCSKLLALVEAPST